MNCERVRHLLSAYLDRELSPEEFRLIRAHLVTCAGCTRELEAEAVLKEALAGLETLEAPEDLLDTVMVRLAAEPEPNRRWVLPLRLAAVGAVAASLFLAVPLVRQWQSGDYVVVEVRTLYRQHSLVSAAQPLTDRALLNYYSSAQRQDRETIPTGVVDRR